MGGPPRDSLLNALPANFSTPSTFLTTSSVQLFDTCPSGVLMRTQWWFINKIPPVQTWSIVWSGGFWQLIGLTGTLGRLLILTTLDVALGKSLCTQASRVFFFYHCDSLFVQMAYSSLFTWWTFQDWTGLSTHFRLPVHDHSYTENSDWISRRRHYLPLVASFDTFFW